GLVSRQYRGGDVAEPVLRLDDFALHNGCDRIDDYGCGDDLDLDPGQCRGECLAVTIERQRHACRQYFGEPLGFGHLPAAHVFYQRVRADASADHGPSTSRWRHHNRYSPSGEWRRGGDRNLRG